LAQDFPTHWPMIGDINSLEGRFRDTAELERLLMSLIDQKGSAMLRLEGQDGLGLVWIREGVIVEARHAGLSGQSALCAVMTIPGGSYWVQPGDVDIQASIQGGDRAALSELVAHLPEWCRLRAALPALTSKFTLDREALYRAAPELTPQDVKILKAAKLGYPIYLLGPESGLPDLVLFRRLIHLMRLHLISANEGSVPPPAERVSAEKAAAPKPESGVSIRPTSAYSVTGSGLIESVTRASPRPPSSRPPRATSNKPAAARKSAHPRLFARSDTPPPVIPKAPSLPADIGVPLPAYPGYLGPPRSEQGLSGMPVIDTTGELQIEPRERVAEGFVSAANFAHEQANMRPSTAPSTARQFQRDVPPVTPVQFGSNYPRPLEADNLKERIRADARAQAAAGSPQTPPPPAAPRWVRRTDRPFAQSNVAQPSSPQDLLLRLPTDPISVAGFRASIFGSLALGLSCLLAAYFTQVSALYLGGVFFLCLHVGSYMAFAARMWGALRGSQRALRWQAVILPLFVPVFGLVWWVRSWLRFVRVTNDVLERTRVQSPKLSLGLVWVSMLLPGLGYVAAWVLIGKVGRAMNTLAAAAEQRQRRLGRIDASAVLASAD